MAKLTHATGELEIQIEDLTVDGNDLVILGTLGIWKARIAVPPPEVAMIMRLLAKPSIVGYMFSLILRRGKRVGG